MGSKNYFQKLLKTLYKYNLFQGYFHKSFFLLLSSVSSVQNTIIKNDFKASLEGRHKKFVLDLIQKISLFLFSLQNCKNIFHLFFFLFFLFIFFSLKYQLYI